MKYFLLTIWFGFLLHSAPLAQAEEMRLAVTTSFHNSGLSKLLLPKIKRDTGIDVHLLVVGTGQALKLGRAGDVDAILVHSRLAEDAFIADGFAPYRREIMYNDFVLVGPETDPANIQNATSAAQAFERIWKTKSPFVSRGDNSGTHLKEMALWASMSSDTSSFTPDWYRAAGAGMGATLNTASAMNAYVMSDRASWLKFANKGALKLHYSGDPVLFNQYAYLPVSDDKHPHVQGAVARKLENWLVGSVAQNLIGNYTINGQHLFTPNGQ